MGRGVWTKIGDYFSLVKFAHTLFALPFALVGYVWGVAELGGFGAGEWCVLGKVLLCMVFARNAAMGFNRVVDRRFDARNRRTAGREIPSGRISVRAAGWFVGANALAFIAAAGWLNAWTLALSPVALGVVLGYSYTKRFTSLCHLILALGLAIAPCGAYLAVVGGGSGWPFGAGFLLPGLVAGVVLTWVSGFDILYALADEAFDRDNGLRSIPAWLGHKKARSIALGLHTVSAGVVLAIGSLFFDMSWLYWLGALLFGATLVYQHTRMEPGERAFTLVNGIASFAYAACTITAIFLFF